MFEVYYEPWTYNDYTLYCTGDWADDSSTYFTSGSGTPSDGACAWDVWFNL